MKEEIGAESYQLKYMSTYSVTRDSEESFGGLFFAEINENLNPLEQEIEEVQTFEMPSNALTHPDIPRIYIQKY